MRAEISDTVRTFLRSCPFAIAYVAPDGRILESSPRFPKLLGLTMQEFLGIKYQDVTHPDDLDADRAQHEALVAGEIESYSIRKRYRHARGHWIWALLEVGIERSTGNAYGFVTDITKLVVEVETAGVFNQIQLAVNAEEFTLFYQPIVELVSGNTVGYEALTRWVKADGTVKSPGSYLRFITGSSLEPKWIEKQLGTLESALSYFPDSVFISFNLSDSILNSAQTKELFPQATSSKRLWIELNEDILMSGQHTRKNIEYLSQKGYNLKMDDLGVGKQWFNWLLDDTSALFSGVKLDKSIVTNCHQDERRMSAVKSIVNLADSQGLKVVAEGIETKEDALALTDCGCGYGQGYFYEKPQPLSFYGAAA